MPYISRFIRFLIPALVIISLPVLSAAREYTLTGKTMGTYYRIKFNSPVKVSTSLWREKTEMRLKEVNARLSMYRKDSEISRFNKTPKDQPFRLSKDFNRVLLQCRDMHTLSRGAWDGTVKPLVDLWGFGTRGRSDEIPSSREIESARARTGFDKLILKDVTLTKTAPGITLDLGSIAKGYGVDEIARLFSGAGIRDYLVEIGGELAGSGKNKRGKPWAVGISNPEKSTINPGLFKVISLDNMAIATSGNYRNFFETGGKTYSHIIDPRTGYPVENKVVSASVITGTCTRADGLATALMVMDTDRGLEMINSLPGTECMIIQKQGETLVPIRSKGFSSFEVTP
ncbi:MAG: FAD:protein FMN transferase [Desulfobacterales bacterium]|nr:FAD:protein FMN transferase [Desulfobacterales bacterium]